MTDSYIKDTIYLYKHIVQYLQYPHLSVISAVVLRPIVSQSISFSGCHYQDIKSNPTYFRWF